ncbi:MAG: hypothetical protein JWO51_971 [Rhodospirillales bacterium]|nr:hypothetical protein [Rhodospirillales bacterium]
MGGDRNTSFYEGWARFVPHVASPVTRGAAIPDPFPPAGMPEFERSNLRTIVARPAMGRAKSGPGAASWRPRAIDLVRTPLYVSLQCVKRRFSALEASEG